MSIQVKGRVIAHEYQSDTNSILVRIELDQYGMSWQHEIQNTSEFIVSLAEAKNWPLMSQVNVLVQND